ncbi:hypothetical protein SAMN05421820_102583 [Pedobacter steynii]|uniref:Uncharacterized protein n=3 Tax=Pedobacter steynii TaxID=430522 RepID=A0A1G9PAM5_9SPHI|nr:hypothetical protein SAMN05421820_102583 [Pedobacter steynii]
MFCLYFSSCKSIHTITEVPDDTYWVDAKQYSMLSNSSDQITAEKVKIEVEQDDTIIKFLPLTSELPALEKPVSGIRSLKMHRYTFDVDIMTIPFKVRPSVSGFPEQLNPNFSAALYLGRRRDNYTFVKEGAKKAKTKITGVGYGYGGFIGVGAVTMNPFVTRGKIDYEYDGFVFSGGIAGILDIKKFNLGLAIGADVLLDKNRSFWIYQGKPWLGVIFGINLN